MPELKSFILNASLARLAENNFQRERNFSLLMKINLFARRITSMDQVSISIALAPVVVVVVVVHLDLQAEKNPR